MEVLNIKNFETLTQKDMERIACFACSKSFIDSMNNFQLTGKQKQFCIFLLTSNVEEDNEKEYSN